MKKAGILLILAVFLSVIFLQLENKEDHLQNKSQPTPEGRDEWRSMMRDYKDSPELILAARQALKHKFGKQNNLKDGGLSQWEYIGPPNVGGRIRAFAIHPTNPDILYTGGVAGGIFKSTDAGATWIPLNDFLPSLSITSIIIHPTNPDIIYVSTGEGITGGDYYLGSSPGAGIFKSIDAGQTWALVEALDANNLDGYYWVNDLAFNSEDPSIFYAAAQGSNAQNPNFSDARLYRFSENGQKVTTLPIPPNTTAYRVYVNPTDSSHIMVGHRDGFSISWDGGKTDWENENDLNPSGFIFFTGRVEIGMSISNPNVVYALCSGTGATGTLLRSDDKGHTWNTQHGTLSIFAFHGDYHNTIWVDPTDADHVILGGIDLWRSTDGGTSITKISDWAQNDAGLSAHADHHIIKEALDYDPVTNPKVYFGNDGGIAKADNWKTVTQTTGWDLLNNGLNITQFYASDIDGANPQEIIAGAQDNGTWYTDDSGSTWTKAGGGDGGFCGLSKQNNDLNYLSEQNGVIRINIAPSNVFLNYWDLATVEFSTPFITVMEIYPNEATKILVGGQKLWQVTSTPNAVHRDVTPPGTSNGELISSIEITPDSSVVAIGYTDGKLFINFAGTSGVWQDRSLPVTGNVKSIAIHPTNTNRIMACVGGYRDDNIWFTNDGGVTWVPRSDGMPALQVNKLIWHPEAFNWIYAGTDMGIMASEDNGSNWNISPNFLGISDGPAFVEVSDLHFTEAGTFGGHRLVATTFGRGIWKTTRNVLADIYVDEDSTIPVETGRIDAPYKDMISAAAVQAHGQTWHIDSGTYPVDTNNIIIISKRLGEILITGTSAVIIGEN